jgi:hypothetical protein
MGQPRFAFCAWQFSARHDDVADRRRVRQHPLQQRQQIVIGDDNLVAGMGGDVADHLGVQSQVQRVQDRAHSRDREVGLQVLGVVPHQRGDALVAVHAERAQRVRELGDPNAGLGVGAPTRSSCRAGDDFVITMSGRPIPHDPGHRQRNVHHGAAHG